MIYLMKDVNALDHSKQHIVPLNGRFEYKQTRNGAIDHRTVVCTICSKEFSFV